MEATGSRGFHAISAWQVWFEPDCMAGQGREAGQGDRTEKPCPKSAFRTRIRLFAVWRREGSDTSSTPPSERKEESSCKKRVRKPIASALSFQSSFTQWLSTIMSNKPVSGGRESFSMLWTRVCTCTPFHSMLNRFSARESAAREESTRSASVTGKVSHMAADAGAGPEPMSRMRRLFLPAHAFPRSGFMAVASAPICMYETGQ